MIETPDESKVGEGGIHRLIVNIECLIHLNQVNSVVEVSLKFTARTVSPSCKN